MFNMDYRTGEMLSANIAYNEFAFQDYYVQRINDYLLSVGAGGRRQLPGRVADDADDPGSVAGHQLHHQPDAQLLPAHRSAGDRSAQHALLRGRLDPAHPVAGHRCQRNGTSTVFGKMQAYLGLPPSTYGNLGPTDFIAQPSQTNDPDFFNAFYALLPYIIYADPATNPYTIPEGGNGTFGPPTSDSWSLLQGEVAFQQAAANINAGTGTGWPYVLNGSGMQVQQAADGADAFRALQAGHHAYVYNKKLQDRLYGRSLDGIDSLSFENVADGVARSCSLDNNPGQWQTKEQWVNDITQAYWGQVEFHEFGHSMGLQHNFMGSIDAPHYPAYALGTCRWPHRRPATRSRAETRSPRAACRPSTPPRSWSTTPRSIA